MKYNNSANRQRFENEQRKLAKWYRAHSMTDEAIQSMYEYDLGVLNSERRYIEHKARVEEITAYDKLTGAAHYMDMDECEGKSETIPFSYRNREWLQEIEDKRLYRLLTSLSDDYIMILSMKMDGYSDTDIASIIGCCNSAVSHKMARIRSKLKKVL